MSDQLALDGQRVVVIGGSAGIGLETARLARAHGAALVLAARNAERLEVEVGPGVGLSLISALTAAGPAFVRNLALEIAGHSRVRHQVNGATYDIDGGQQLLNA